MLSYRVPEPDRKQLQNEIHQLLAKQQVAVGELIRRYESDATSADQPPLGVGFYFWRDPEQEYRDQ